MNNFLKIINISKIYNSDNGEIEAIKDISFNVTEGDFIAIVGPSGCGKSTLLSIISGLEEKTGGKIKFNKDKITIGYMLQQDALFPWLSVLDNTLLGISIKQKITNKDIAKIKNMLKKYGLEDYLDKYPNELSGGMRQRVALIRTLATKPDILLLDEPFCALDYQTRLQVSDDVYKIIRENNKTTLLVTHDLAEAISMADKIIVLSKRPTSIKTIYSINLTNKSTPINNRKAPEFSKYYESLWKALDNHE